MSDRVAIVGIDRNEDGLRELPNGIHQVPGDTTDPAVPKELVGDCEHQAGGAELFDVRCLVSTVSGSVPLLPCQGATMTSTRSV
jgi:hypothetical protein